MRHFAVELEQLQQQLLQMGGLVESAIHRAVRCLVDRSSAEAESVIRDEPRINQMQIDIDKKATSLLALQQPMARDLRLIMAVLKINTDLERMGDLAVNIAKRAVSVQSRPSVKQLVDIPHMASLAEGMLLKSLDAFVNEDATKAEEVLASDDEVDRLRDSVYNELVAYMQREPEAIPGAIDLIFIARNLERIADHATNIAEDVFFFVKGIDVRHHSPKTI